MEDNLNESNQSYVIKYQPGDLVILDMNYQFKHPIMRETVRNHHVFVIIDVNESKDKYLVYAMTSKVDRIEKFPEYYVKVQSGRKLA